MNHFSMWSSLKRIWLIVLVLVMLVPPASGQEGEAAPITFSGTVESIDASTLMAAGLLVDTRAIDPALVTQIQVGATITVSGTVSNGVVTATEIVLNDPAESENMNYAVVFDGLVFDGLTTTYSYTVTGTGTPPALSFFIVELPVCTLPLEVITATPNEAVEVVADPNTNIYGIKWDLPLAENASRTYSFSFDGYVALGGPVQAAVKGGNEFFIVLIEGPSCTQPQIDIEKYLSVDGGNTWLEADPAPGEEVAPGTELFYRFEIFNRGNVLLTEINLIDDVLDTSVCSLPESLEPEASTECVLGPFTAGEGLHTNIALVNARYDTVVVTDTDSASYYNGDVVADDDEDADRPIIIIIEGPVTAIEGNIIVIFGFDIELEADDPALDIIQIGDILRIEGALSDSVVVVINIVFVDVDIYIDEDGDGEVWRDTGECANPPPPWAPAVGWRRKCEGGNGYDPNARPGRGNN